MLVHCFGRCPSHVFPHECRNRPVGARGLARTPCYLRVSRSLGPGAGLFPRTAFSFICKLFSPANSSLISMFWKRLEPARLWHCNVKSRAETCHAKSRANHVSCAYSALRATPARDLQITSCLLRHVICKRSPRTDPRGPKIAPRGSQDRQQKPLDSPKASKIAPRPPPEAITTV